MGTVNPSKRLLLQGATGSIGRSTLSVVREHPQRFRIAGLACNASVEDLMTLAEEFRPDSLAIAGDSVRESLEKAAKRLGIERIYVGANAAADQARESNYDLLVNALAGSAGLEPTAEALMRGISVAVANKETLVAAGPLMQQIAARNGASILPIDSEHSAIFQCLLGERIENVRRIWLTTSGGPFWGKSQSDLQDVTVAQALDHPTWKMGPKVTVDSATLFNKGLEVIEAQRLFGVAPEQIEVVVHRQSIVHSMVEYIDGSFKAQLSTPDMRLPILFSLSYPERYASELAATSMSQLRSLTFEPVTRDAIPCLALAYAALEKGGTAPAALSAADEVAVHAFLEGQIRFTEIADVIASVIRAWPTTPLTDLQAVRAADQRARALAEMKVAELSSAKERRCC
jgi:1-deoxy-D-xylulose-5-phosphate reductoisomerase